MADEYRAGPGEPGSLYRQFKQTGYHPTTGEPVYAEMVSLDSGSIGGGGSNTQYAEGATAATATGTVSLWKDSSTTVAAISSSKPLPVNVVAGGAGGGAMTVADGADVTLGTTTDAAVGDATGTVNAHMRQVAKLLGGTLTVGSHAVTNAGTFAVQAAATLSAETTKVIGTINIATAQTVGLVAGTAVIGHVIVDTAPSTAVTNAGTFAVQAAATLAAETTKVIGVVRTADGSGNLLTTTSNALDVNIKTSAASNISSNIAQINGVTPLMGAGNTGTGSLRVTVASDQAVIPISDNAASLTVDAPVGTPVFTTPTPSTTGGWSVDSRTALTNTAVAIKASAGTFGGYMFYNPNVTATFIQVFNVAAASVTLGTTTPTFVIELPATSAANLEITNGIGMSTAMSYASTTTATGSTAPSSSLCGFAMYK